MGPVTVSREIGGRTLSFETGRIAKQADGAVWVRYGDTIVLVTAVSATPREGIDFFPLTVDYREMMYAAGKIPGGFFKREGRSTTKETLTARSIDRPLRPLFPERYRNEVAITANVLSADQVNEPDVLAMTGASAALRISSIPFENAVGSVRVGLVGDAFVLNPTVQEMEESLLDLLVSGTRDKVVMIEVEAKEVPEAKLIEAIKFGHKAVQDIIDMQEELVKKAGVPKQAVPAAPEGFEAAQNAIDKLVGARIAELFAMSAQGKGITKLKRKEYLAALKAEVKEHFASANPDFPPNKLAEAFESVYAKIFRHQTLAGKTRVDGRKWDQLRKITCETGVLPNVHGSALFTRGETQALVVTTLGARFDEQRVEGLNEEVFKTFMLHYNFPAYSVGETWANRGPKRREIGHGDLAERSVRGVLPPHEEFPYTIRVVSDIQESNGSTSMASTCGATLSLMDAGVQIKRPVAGISVGLIQEGSKYCLLTDIQGDEDHHGDMDFKVCGTQDGVTGVQVDLKIGGLTYAVIEEAIAQARAARMDILKIMQSTLPKPKAELAPNAPRLERIKIPSDKIGLLIGPGGRTIRELQATTGAKVDVEDDGTVTVWSKDAEAVRQVRQFIEGMTAVPEIGRVYKGRVTGIKDFGAFVEFLPGQEGLVHVSELSDTFVKDVNSVVKMGDTFNVKVLAIDEQGRVKLSRKAAEPKAASTEGGRKK